MLGKTANTPAITTLMTVMLSLVDVSHASSGCGNLRSVSVNDENIRYLRSWISNELDDARIIRLFGRYGTLKMTESPNAFNRLNFDFDKAGLSPHFTGIKLNRVDTENYVSFDIIESVSFWEVRDFLMVGTDQGFNIEDDIDRDKKYYENWDRVNISKDIILFCR